MSEIARFAALLIKSTFCHHEWEWVRNIYGDEINAVGGRRSWWRCKKCGWLEPCGEYHDEGDSDER